MEYLLMLVTFVPVVVITVFIPYVTRKTESFGVSIPEDVYHSDELSAMRKRYARLSGLLGVIVLALWMVFANSFSFEIISVIAVFLYIAGGFVIYLKFHFQMKRLKADRNWQAGRSEVVAVDTTFREQKVAYSNSWFIIPFLITIGTAAMSLLFYEQMPEKIPMNYNFSGEVTRWAEKSYGSVLQLPAIQLFLTVLFVFLNAMIGKYKQQVDVANPEKSVSQNVVFRRRWSAFNIITGTAIVLIMAFTQLSFIVSIHPTILVVVPLVVVGGIIAGAMILAFTTGQGGSRVKVAKGKQGENINRDDDHYWKLGQFYFNPNDPAIWVEKRFGVGWTINLAHPASWGTLLAILVIPLLITFLA